jgi:hypothetical protein
VIAAGAWRRDGIRLVRELGTVANQHRGPLTLGEQRLAEKVDEVIADA